MMLCCGCKKDHGQLRTQILDPNSSNNYLYQQHLHLHQQQQQQNQLIQQQQNQQNALIASALVPGGGQQRYVGGINYVMQQQLQPQAGVGGVSNNYNQLSVNQPMQLTAGRAGAVSPARSNFTTTAIANQSMMNQMMLLKQQPSYTSSSMLFNDNRSRIVSDLLIQPDSFRRISGITSEVFRQIEAVEAEFDPSTLAAQYAEMERRGEMIIRILSPASIVPAWLEDTCRRYGDGISLPSWVQFVEIIKRPGQTLGLYIREGDALYTSDGVYISRIALESPVYQSGCLRVGDEILAVNLVDVSRMSLDDVVIVMSIPRRLILTIRSKPLNATEHLLDGVGHRQPLYGNTLAADSYYDTVAASSDIYSRVDELRKPVVVLKQQQRRDEEEDIDDEDDTEDDENATIVAATAAAEAGLLDDPSVNPASVVAAVAAAASSVANARRNRTGSLDLEGSGGYASGRSSAMSMSGRHRHQHQQQQRQLSELASSRRRLFANTADNLAELYQQQQQSSNDIYGMISGSGSGGGNRHRRSGSLINYDRRSVSRLGNHRDDTTTKALIAAAAAASSSGKKSSLYHGRLAPGTSAATTSGSRSRSNTGRLIRTASEQLLAAADNDQIDYFLERYNTLRQLRSGNGSSSLLRNHSLDRYGSRGGNGGGIRNSLSSQTLIPGGQQGATSNSTRRNLEALGIPLPGLIEAAAAAGKRGGYYDNSLSDTEASIYDQLMSSGRSGRSALLPSASSSMLYGIIGGSRSSSLPRTGLPMTGKHLSGMRSSGSGSGTGSGLGHRLQQLENFYAESGKSPSRYGGSGSGRITPSLGQNQQSSSSYSNRPHSAIGNYHSEEEDGESAQLRRNLGLRYLQQRQQLLAAVQQQQQHKQQHHSGAGSQRASGSSGIFSTGDPNSNDDPSMELERKLGRMNSNSTSAIYETIRKQQQQQQLQQQQNSKMAQDQTQPHSGRLLIGSGMDEQHQQQQQHSKRYGSGTGSLQRYGKNDSKDDYLNTSSRHISGSKLSSSAGDFTDYDMMSSSPTPEQQQQHQRQQQLDQSGGGGPSGGHLFAAMQASSHYQQQPPTGMSRPLMIDPSGFQQYGPEMRTQREEMSIAGYSGLLVIHLLGVRGLQLESTSTTSTNPVSTSTSGLIERNLYCVVECDRVYKARTVAVQSHDTNVTNFDWDEIFDIDLFDTKEVTFLFYTWNPSSRHKLCSKGTIHLPSISTLRSQHVHAFEMRLYETPGAMLYIKLEFHDLPITFKRVKRDPKLSTGTGTGSGGGRRGSRSIQLQTEQPLFGVELDGILARENSGFSVPIIIKRCTEEIEQRGLHLVGIYRLCGSAIRKRNLRDQFEKNAWLADLSGDNVPDINVITSLLKDYLRELPEPLFNKALFNMMDDGLSVCVPDDPAGNAKLMFSILECLSKTSRNTVLYLMDHIKLIHLNADRNKMTSQALAICFGPLFSCHYESESVHKAIQVFKFLLDIWPPRRGSFNFLRKLDDIKSSGSDLAIGASSTSSGSVTAASGTGTGGGPGNTGTGAAIISSTANRQDHRNLHAGITDSSGYGMISGSGSANSRGGNNPANKPSTIYDSPPTSYQRFNSSSTSGGAITTTSSTSATTLTGLSYRPSGFNVTTTTVTSTNANASGMRSISPGNSITSTLSSGSGGAGTGRLLPSTQNATRTISIYSDADVSTGTKIVSQIKMPPGSSGPSVLNPGGSKSPNPSSSNGTIDHSSIHLHSKYNQPGSGSSNSSMNLENRYASSNTTTNTTSSQLYSSSVDYTTTSALVTTTSSSGLYNQSNRYSSSIITTTTSFNAAGYNSRINNTTTTLSSGSTLTYNSDYLNSSRSTNIPISTTTNTTFSSRPSSSYSTNITSNNINDLPFSSEYLTRRSYSSALPPANDTEAIYSTVNKSSSATSSSSNPIRDIAARLYPTSSNITTSGTIDSGVNVGNYSNNDDSDLNYGKDRIMSSSYTSMGGGSSVLPTANVTGNAMSSSTYSYLNDDDNYGDSGTKPYSSSTYSPYSATNRISSSSLTSPPSASSGTNYLDSVGRRSYLYSSTTTTTTSALTTTTTTGSTGYLGTGSSSSYLYSSPSSNLDSSTNSAGVGGGGGYYNSSSSQMLPSTGASGGEIKPLIGAYGGGSTISTQQLYPNKSTVGGATVSGGGGITSSSAYSNTGNTTGNYNYSSSGITGITGTSGIRSYSPPTTNNNNNYGTDDVDNIGTNSATAITSQYTRSYI